METEFEMASTSYGQLREFTLKDDWSVYKARMEQYFIANGVPVDTNTSQVRRAILLNCCDEEAYKLLFDLCVPQIPEEKTYIQLVNIFDEQFKKVASVYAERYKFYNACKSSHETVLQWAARVRNLATTCKFGNELQSALRDRFIMGVEKGPILDKLFEEDETLTLEKAIAIATRKEASNSNYDIGCVQDEIKKEPLYQLKQRENRRKDTAKEKYTHASMGGSSAVKGNSYRAQQIISRSKDAATESTEHCVTRKCSVCGRSGHNEQSCRFKTYICNICHRRGHLANVCTHKTLSQNFLEDQIDSLYHLTFKDVCKPITVNVKLANKECCIELDTGASVSVISEEFYKENFSMFQMLLSDRTLFNYVGSLIHPLGYVQLPVEYKDIKKKIDIYVISGGGPPLLGRNFFYEFGLSVNYVENVKSTNDLSQDKTNNMVIHSIVSKFYKVFSSTLGHFREGTIHLSLKENSEPKFFKARPIPYGIRDKVEQEINRLVNEGILVQVDYSEWGTPIVPVAKRNGSLRICGDYKVTINPHLKIDQYPLPRIQDLFSKLQGGKQFTKLDLSQAYQQVELDEESSRLTTISTHKGLFRYTRLPFGVACAPAKFQKIIEQTLQGIEGVICFLDDILITGCNKEQHIQRVEEVLERLQNCGLTISKGKSEFFKDSVVYLGHKIDSEGLHKLSDKVDAIVKVNTPKNQKELKSFLGLVNYYNRFVPNSAMILEPLYNLLRKGAHWKWDNRCIVAFEKIKQILSSNKVLVHYDPKLPIKLTVDASPVGIAAVLSHIVNGVEKPVAYASQLLNEAQKRYSQIEREGLAIIFGVKKFYHYIFGNKFTLVTDHKPLVNLFGPKRGIPQMTANRLQRWALILSNFVYDIEYVPSEKNNADAFSRLPIQGNLDESLEEFSYLNHITENLVLPVDWREISLETEKDQILSKITEFIKKGWPVKVDREYKQYALIKNNLTIEKGCILFGYRVIVPKTLQPKILLELHSTHQGIVKMKSIARSYVWWPNLNIDIENLVKNCDNCMQTRSNPPKAELIPWEFPKNVWERIHMDYLGPINNKYIFVLVDAHSKWMEAYITNKITSLGTIQILRDIFARFGIPKCIVSDNASYFVSHDMNEFMRMNGIIFKKIPPFSPATNGLAESGVKTIKHMLKTCLADVKQNDLEVTLKKVLINYRNTPHSTTQLSPAQLFLGRNLRTRLDLLRPIDIKENIDVTNVYSNVENSHKQQIKFYHGKRAKMFKINDSVVVRDYRFADKSWIRGKIHKVLGPRTYIVFIPKLDKCWKRHINQILDYNTSTSISNSNDTTKTEDVDDVSDLALDTSFETNISLTDTEMETANDNTTNRPKRIIRKPIRFQQ